MTAFRQHVHALSCASRPNAVGDGSRADVPRAKALKPIIARQLRLARERAGLTQEQLASATGTSRTTARRWESADEADTPSVLHLSIAPRDYVLPLLRHIAEQHALEVLAAAALVHGDDDYARSRAIVTACANAQRASTLLEKPTASAGELELCEREFLRAAEVALEAARRVRERLREAGKR